MGVSELWTLLKSEGTTTSWSGRDGAHADVVKEVENTAIAIDLSTWILQATSQPNLVEVFQDPECRALIVTFNRVRSAVPDRAKTAVFTIAQTMRTARSLTE